MIEQAKKIKELELLKEQRIFFEVESPALTDVHIISILKNGVDEFQYVIKQNGSDDMFREIISSTIKKIEEIENGLDTEDKEAVCLYFEKMMDAVELESSGGILNTWLYGFNPEDY
ncbi:hypothetical protein DBR40_01595 [Pedobacter sp. KBW01]|uniref:DUF4844 domain-containing protein n=1 Tax=Pedobacter sp. KBW01 TaxID=2153364 RepID=UPI000F5B3BC8|nr:DUF4844 domain-containing protein [Pedobacter sp. KBW01]RQO79680.1 hypothetical protein DBR40_01595 [Pedobacter sp. KBW01]